MFTRILVLLDGSALAERAIPAAERLAAATGATLHLARVVDVPQTLEAAHGPGDVPGDIYGHLVARETEAASTYLAAACEHVGDELHVTARVLQIAGDTATTLLDYERDEGIDLVVMCSRGRGTGSLTRFPLGSIAERLLRHSPVPILLVRTVGAPATLEHAVVPLDGSVLSEEALGVVAALARTTTGDVACEATLLRAVEASEQRAEAEQYLEEAERRLREMVAPSEVICARRVEQGDPAQVIIDVAGTDRLIVMTSHGRSGWTRWALGSVTQRVACYATAKVMVLRKEIIGQPVVP